MSNEVQKTTPAAPGALALPSSLMERLAAEAKAAAAKERPSVGVFGAKAGMLTYGGQPVPGNKVEVVVVAASFRNVWYANKYDPNNIVAPNCFALALEDVGMAPHAVVGEKPHSTCAGCPYNEWGSDPGGGRGKACKQSRRLILLPADAIDKGAEAVLSAEFARMDLPVTSVKNYSTYVNTLAASASVPPYAAVAEITVTPDVKTQFKVNFRPMRVVPSEEILEAIIKRMEAAEKLALEPYEETALLDDGSSDEEDKKATAPAKSKTKSKF